MSAPLIMAFLASASLLPAQSFFAPPAPPPETLPTDQVFPRGRIFPFIGFSGKAQWQKDNGYTVFGPVYGDEANQMKALAEATGSSAGDSTRRPVASCC